MQTHAYAHLDDSLAQKLIDRAGLGEIDRKVQDGERLSFEDGVEGGRGGWCYEMNGLLGWALEEVGFDKATVKSLVGSILKPDIDTDGDNEPDAISIALALETVAAEVTGYKAD